ncbi:MAG: ATP-binding protein [Gemmatimonadetes bacterium]|nr:ATP-binding protein [Gemmatimonadota bacterium]MYF73240.1 ATP-binding protein [Gemmatimonadota bacterium]MYK50406.1 ATP-binding protein [Gemmatimonadota bacterium]
MHHITEFKGLKDVSIDLMRPFTLLIGPNGSGKTNVIEAIELLSFIARGQPLYEIANVGRTETGLQIRGGLQACGHMGEDIFALGFGASLRFDGVLKQVLYRIHLRTKPHSQIQYEELKVGDRVIYKTLPKNSGTASRDVMVIYDNFADRGRNPQTAVSSQRSVLSQYPEIAQKNRKAHSLSDGILRTLAILTALETVQASSHVIVENFDNGLHPGRIGILTSAIAEAIERRDLRVLVTTHNPATMNNLTPEQMQGVVLCTWSEEKQAADLVELDSLPRSDELLERGPLGDLVSRRVIEQYLAPEFEEQHRQKMLKWVKTLP